MLLRKYQYKVYPFNMLKDMDKSDVNYLKGPIISLIVFVVIAFIIFPKPSKIYKDGVLKECTCLGVQATPRASKGAGVGDRYCLGVPIKCEKTQVLKDAK